MAMGGPHDGVREAHTTMAEREAGQGSFETLYMHLYAPYMHLYAALYGPYMQLYAALERTLRGSPGEFGDPLYAPICSLYAPICSPLLGPLDCI
jgi:hypothetical protein